MSRIGTNPNNSSDQFEARMLPSVDDVKQEDDGEYMDYQGDGRNKVYMAPWQKKVRNFGSRSTKVLAARGTGKTSFLAFHMTDVTIGLPRMMGGFCGASAKQNYTRTMPNVLKVVNLLGFAEGVYYFLGRPPAKLRWPTPIAKPRVWENCVSFANGFVWQMISLAVKGSANGLNLVALMGDETKYMPWPRVKEEVLPTLRGDFMPKSARKVEQRRWGYGTDPKVNNHWLSQLWVSDTGLNARECLWENEQQYETTEVNDKIKKMMAEIRYLEKYHPKQAVQLAKNDNFLKELYALRTQSETFWRFSSIENAALLGGLNAFFLRNGQVKGPVFGLFPDVGRFFIHKRIPSCCSAAGARPPPRTGRGVETQSLAAHIVPQTGKKRNTARRGAPCRRGACYKYFDK